MLIKISSHYQSTEINPQRLYHLKTAITTCVLIAGALLLPGQANAVGDIYGSGGDIDALLTIGATVYGPILTTSGPFAFTSESTSGQMDSKKVMAKDDAAAFIATAGAYRGAYLEALFRELREQQPTSEATNEQDIALWLLQTQP